MTKTTWTAQTKSQLVAALARKGYDRNEVRRAADRAVENGFAWAWGRLAGALCMALVTFSDTEVDMWDASLHTEAEVSCNVCNTMAHMPKRLTQVEGIGNACTYCMQNVRDLDATAARWTALVESGELDAEHTAESIAALRNLAAHLAPKPQAEVGHYVRTIESGLIVFVLAEAPEFGTIEVRHNNGVTGWGNRAAFATMTEDEELSAAIAWGLATGQLVDATEWLAQQEADEAARLAYDEWQQDEAAQAEHEAAGPEHATWCAGPMAHVVEFATCGVCLTRQPAARMTRAGSEFVCSECSPADLAASQAAAVRAALSDVEATYDVTMTNGSGTRHLVMAGTQATVWTWCCRAGEQPGNLAGYVPVGITPIGSEAVGPFVLV